jgi:hypothetical protein
MREAFLLVAALAFVVLLAGCPSAEMASDLGPPTFFSNGTYTVSGTITSNKMNLAPSATVSLSSNGDTVSKQVTVPAPDPQDTTGAQVVTYSFSGIGNITVDVTLTATSQNNWNSPGSVSCSFSQDQAPVPSTMSGTNPKTFTLGGVSITKSTAIDVLLNAPLVGGGK